MRYLGALFLLALLSACSMFGSGEDKQTLVITQYGLYKNGQLAMTTEAVPVALGATFGCRFKYVGEKGAGPVKATVTTSSPGMVDPATGLILPDNVDHLTLEPGREYEVFFTFKQTWEMVSGPWVFKVATEKGETLEKSFDVFDPSH